MRYFKLNISPSIPHLPEELGEPVIAQAVIILMRSYESPDWLYLPDPASFA